MNKAYSTKALPPGTVLREWRLEEVLGVGGFGIVYKGRGIYFDELVAIKEYFPSAISERKDGDTVVPVDSDAEEVHALGLKKFVEEAKLLWNLSTPTRHPNIVSVRSLFEIHGTAYMVMDFEDGVSLSKMLKQGARFNQASLTALIRPIAEGLERAHRVGVLHRDIKPPNILINEDGRPVLIDFGSARFESGEATNTKVTFHTPPYAPIEQYVKTYAQGPWTDVYALGVVLYECITGHKPPEVLERLHGGLGAPLADETWPGFSRPFLKAVDAAMIIRPDERPQSIAEWLGQFDLPEDALPPRRIDTLDEEDATQFAVFEDHSDRIVPVAPQPPGFEVPEEIPTPVPESTSEVRFKRAGQDTSASQRKPVQEIPVEVTDIEVPVESPAAEPDIANPPEISPASEAPENPDPPRTFRKKLALAGVAGAAVLLGTGWYMAGGVGGNAPDPALAAVSDFALGGLTADAGANITATTALVTQFGELEASARSSGAPGAADLGKAVATIGELTGKLDDPSARSATGGSIADEIAGIAGSASARFATALQADLERRVPAIAKVAAWADPRRSGAASGQPAANQKIAANLRAARSGVQSAAAALAGQSDAVQAVALARQALGSWGSFRSASALALKAKPGDTPLSPTAETAAIVTGGTPVVQSLPVEEASPASRSSGAAYSGISPGRQQKFDSVVSASRDLASKVIKLGKNAKQGSSDQEKERYRILRQNVKSAEGYKTYLDTLASSLRGAKSDVEVDQAIAKAEETRTYLNVLLSRSTAASQ